MLIPVVVVHLLIIGACSTNASVLVDALRAQRTISLQSQQSSPAQIHLNRSMSWNLTCTFLSNFPQVDLFWLHNGTLIDSFIAPVRTEKAFAIVSIVSTIELSDVHADMSGFYQCIAVHREIHVQQTFDVHVNNNDLRAIRTDFSRHAKIVVHTSQALFERPHSVVLMCRVDRHRSDTCRVQWFDPDEQPMPSKTDLLINSDTQDTPMGLYTCRVCCANGCDAFTSFVYSADEDQ